MTKGFTQRAILVGLWLNAGLLLCILMTTLSRYNALPSLLPAAFAQSQAPIAGGAGVFVMPAQFSPNTWGCYLLDVDSQTLAAYQFYPGEKQLRFVAARTYRFDRRMTNFNTLPSPSDMKDVVEKQQQELRNNPNSQPVKPEAPAN